MPYITIAATAIAATALLVVGLFVMKRRKKHAPSAPYPPPSTAPVGPPSPRKQPIESPVQELPKEVETAVSGLGSEEQEVLGLLDKLDRLHRSGRVPEKTCEELREDCMKRLMNIRAGKTGPAPAGKYCINCGAPANACGVL